MRRQEDQVGALKDMSPQEQQVGALKDMSHQEDKIGAYNRDRVGALKFGASQRQGWSLGRQVCSPRGWSLVKSKSVLGKVEPGGLEISVFIQGWSPTIYFDLL